MGNVTRAAEERNFSSPSFHCKEPHVTSGFCSGPLNLHELRQPHVVAGRVRRIPSEGSPALIKQHIQGDVCTTCCIPWLGVQTSDKYLFLHFHKASHPDWT